MSRLSELKQKLADLRTAVQDLAAQAEHSTCGETHRLLRKRENELLAMEYTQNDIDMVLHRSACLRNTQRRAQENLDAMDHYIGVAGRVDPARVRALENGRTTIQREIDGIVYEIARLGAPG
jgi:hypothetical protein